jgi:hypothetical protein
VAGLFALTSSFALACRLVTLDLGADNPPPVVQVPPDIAAPDAAEAEAAASLEATLLARCAADPGPSDAYFSASELTSRLVARWFNCGSSASSPIQNGDGDGIVFRADGSWAILSWNARRDGFDASVTPTLFGTYRYYFFVDSEAGAAAEAGVASGDVARNDPTNRTPLVVYLDRPGNPDGLNLTFSKKPRQMSVVESASALRGRYVPID